MALLTVEDELARAADVVPFANGYEYDSWSSIWCNECYWEQACPLLLVILHEKTPAAWVDREPGALNRYTCTEYKDKNTCTQIVDLEETCTGSSASSLAPTASPDASLSLKDGLRTSSSSSPGDISSPGSTLP